MTAMLEVEALFTTADGQLQGTARDPDLVLSLHCELTRVLDLTDRHFDRDLGTNLDELVSLSPSRFVLNARGEETPTQRLGAACSFSGRISALKVPSAANDEGFCIDVFPESLTIGEHVTVLDQSNRIKAKLEGIIPRTS